MLTSRSLALCRTLQKLQIPIQNNALKSLRNSHTWSYRVSAPAPSGLTRYTAEAISGFMWWWILWHLWHEPEHITGEFPYPDPSKWTNEELGIPPDE